MSTGLIFSDVAPAERPAETVVHAAALVPVKDVQLDDPAVGSIDRMLARYAGNDLRGRVARAVVDSSRRYDVDARLVAAIIIIESSANPLAISDRKSVGIMQIHLVTWGETVEQEDLNLFDVEDNIDLGVRILKGYIRQHGVWEGVKRYKGWIATPESELEADEYVETVRSIYQPDMVSPEDAGAP